MFSRNPFVNQVFGFARLQAPIGKYIESQSLRESGLWFLIELVTGWVGEHHGRNPFVNQVFGFLLN